MIFSLTASVLSCVTPSLHPGQPVPAWSWGSVYLSASSVLLCCSSCRAPWFSFSVHTAHPLSANTSGLSRTASHQPVPVLLSSFPSSFLSKRLLFLRLFRSSVFRSIFPAWRSRISCVVYAPTSTEWNLRYTAWLRPRLIPASRRTGLHGSDQPPQKLSQLGSSFLF